jgi:proline iminopeptidase
MEESRAARADKAQLDGVRYVTIDGGYKVWTRKVGSGPARMLLLHGGPGCTHEYLECFEDRMPLDEVELVFYDQLGSFYSDQPDDTSLWRVERFVEEVEQVRQALGLEDFYLYGNSWGGMLGIEYALKYQKHLRGLIVSNMTASIADYARHVNELRERLPADLVARMKAFEERGDYENPEYEGLVIEHLYNEHLCRVHPWPDALMRTFVHLAKPVYNTMQGPNEFVITGNFATWDRWDDLAKIEVPTLLSVGRHDTMRVEEIEEMGRRIPGARVSICENGSHLPMWDDPDAYFASVVDFVRSVEARRATNAEAAG